MPPVHVPIDSAQEFYLSISFFIDLSNHLFIYCFDHFLLKKEKFSRAIKLQLGQNARMGAGYTDLA